MHGHMTTILFDGVATHNFVSEQFVKDKLKLRSEIIREGPIDNIAMGNRNEEECVGTINLKFQIGKYVDHAIFYVTKLGSRNDAILGKPWFYMNNPRINWR
ncbi:MAG TPA: retropepsin-like aspartic protease [Bacteroidota bacterium]|nr:retropepsin-like aspartic protease [Bacteroidota bacterium]